MILNSPNKIWLFDYDLTLYGEDERFVLNSLDKRIAEFVQKTLNTTFDEATKIRKDYLLKFGTTLAGLMATKNVNPNDFFDFIHEPQFLIYPKKSPSKIRLLGNIKGNKFVFTNGRKDWSEAGIKSMEINPYIKDIFDLKNMDWQGKPHISAYLKLEHWLEKKEILPLNKSDIILLEDSIKNLEPAKDLGWTTILIQPTPQNIQWVDFQIAHLLDLSKILQ